MKHIYVISVLLVVALSCSSYGNTIELLGPSEWVHLGDSTVSGWPTTVGNTWTTTFDLSGPATEDGILSFKHIEADPLINNVYMNSVMVGTLTESDGTITRDPNDPTQWVDQTITIPLSSLAEGINTLQVACGVSFPGSGFPYDDFMLRDMTVTVVPEPASIGLIGLVSAGFCFIRRRIVV